MNNSELETILTRLRDKDQEIRHSALQTLHKQVRENQGTVGIKNQEFLDILSNLEDSLEYLEMRDKQHLYDILSVLNVLENDQNVLRFRIMGNVTDLDDWGHHYVRKLCQCIVDVVNDKLKFEDYQKLIDSIIKFLFSHNSEIEAIDFIIEISGISVTYSDENNKSSNYKCLEESKIENTWNLLFSLIDIHNRDRVILYLEELSKFYNIEDFIIKINEHDASKYLISLLKFDRKQEAIEFVKSLNDEKLKKQCLYILARNAVYYKGDSVEEHILTNSHITDIFFEVALSLEVLQPKKLEYMFKGLNKERIDAAAIANSLVHFGYCRDPVHFPQEGDFRIKQDYLDQLKLNKSISTYASVGLVNAYDSSKVYEYFSDKIAECAEVGPVLALALSAYKSHDSNGAILNLLSPFLASGDRKTVLSAMLGINALYSASSSQNIYDEIFPLFSSQDPIVSLFAIYILGSVYPGDAEILSSCIELYNALPKDSAFSNLAILGLSLFFYKLPGAKTGVSSDESKQNYISKMNALFCKLDKYAKILSLGFMYIGSGNPVIVDDILSEAFSGDTDALLESLGMISSCLIGIGDSQAVLLLERISTSSLLLDSSHLRSVTPLCIAMLYCSNPKSDIVDILEKSINSGDSTINSLIALGIVGAGSCSSKILRIFDSNFSYLYKDSKASSILLLSQGLINLGKGLFTISPLCYDKNIILQRSVIGIVSSIFMFLDTSMFKDYPFLLLSIVNSISPKYVVGFNGSIKIGKPVEIVGLAGNPNKISGAIIHTMPVVINENEKAQVEEDVYTFYIEDVLVKK